MNDTDTRNVVFIGNDAPWYAVLRKALPPSIHLFDAAAENADTALEERGYDLIVLDIMNISNKEGLREAVCSLKGRQHNSHVLVASASPTWKLVREAMKAGASDFLDKSYDPKRIARILNKYLPT